MTVRTNRAYVELASGLHFLRDGQWQKTREWIENFTDGVVARHGPHRVIFANVLDWAGSSLLNQGSRSAAEAGLYHHTVLTNQTRAGKLGNGRVSIGYHYVALDAAGQPLDSDADGIADYRDEDADGDGLPDGWELAHFGNLSQGAYDDYDNDGLTNLEEYLAGTDPNTIRFATRYDNLYVNNRMVTGSCEILGGTPSFIAVLVNDTNLIGATWETYTGDFGALLPDADGTHTVWVALRGRSTDFPPAWDETEFTLDRVPPVLLVTNPVSTTVIKPVLQLQGLADEPLVSLRYDLTNAAGLLTNEPAYVVDQYFDADRFDITTNYFQAFDVELTDGLNEITLYATDRAGNVTVTNLAVTLDYATATNPPVLELLWPSNGAHLSGDSFYVRGRINDETAQVWAEWVDPAGRTNVTVGLVERDGTFWVEALPLTAGSNWVRMTATDAAGNAASSNLIVMQSTVRLTITATPEGEHLYEPLGTVSGTVSDPSYAVIVNGVAAMVDEWGNWTAQNVPVVGLGTAVFTAQASPPSGGGGPVVSASAQVEMPAQVIVAKHRVSKTLTEIYGNDSAAFSRAKSYQAGLVPGPDGNWVHRYFGMATDRYEYSGVGSSFWSQSVYQWTATNRSTHYTDSTPSEWSSTNIWGDSFGEITGVPDKDLREPGWPGGSGGVWGYPPVFLQHYEARGVRHESKLADGGIARATVRAPRTELKLYTGGKAGLKRKSLIHIEAGAEAYGRPPGVPWLHTPATPVPAGKIQVLGWWLFERQMHPNGDLYVALPDGAVKELNLRVPGLKHYGAWATATKHKFVHETACVALTDTNRARTKLGVGEYVSIRFEPGDFPTNAVWTVTAGSVEPTEGNATLFTAPSNAATAIVTANVAGTAKFKIRFNVKAPIGYDRAVVRKTILMGDGAWGAEAFLRVFIAPTDVSFYRVEIGEVGLDATDVWGRYAVSIPPPNGPYKPEHLKHESDRFAPVSCDNRWNPDAAYDMEGDHVRASMVEPQFAGGFMWPIPARWRIPGGTTNSLPYWSPQVVTVSSNGVTRITKFGIWLERTTNNIYTIGP